MLQRLPIALARIKAGNQLPEKLLNEICQIIYVLISRKINYYKIILQYNQFSTNIIKIDTIFINS